MIGFITLSGDNHAKYYIRPGSIESLDTEKQGATSIWHRVGSNEVRELVVYERPSEIADLILQGVKDEIRSRAYLRSVEDDIRQEEHCASQVVPEGDWPTEDGGVFVSGDEQKQEEPEWLARAKQERDELNERITALTRFLNGRDFDLPEQEEKMLQYQLTTMREYSGVLQARLDLH